MPLIPFMFLLAASLITYLFEKTKKFHSILLRRISLFGVSILLTVGLIWPTFITVKEAIQLSTVDSRETARVWIQENLPPKSHIAIEAYSPFVDPKIFSIVTFARIPDPGADWYLKNGYEYLVFSEGMFGRYFNEPEKYSEMISKYEAFFNRFMLVKTFTDGGYEVRIYKVK